MTDIVLSAFGVAFLMATVALAILVDRAEARAANQAPPRAPRRGLMPEQPTRRLRLVRPDP